MLHLITHNAYGLLQMSLTKAAFFVELTVESAQVRKSILKNSIFSLRSGAPYMRMRRLVQPYKPYLS